MVEKAVSSSEAWKIWCWECYEKIGMEGQLGDAVESGE
jgi:hypothetical protein